MDAILDPSFLLPVLLVWSEQVFVVAAAVGLACLAISNPKVRLAVWQSLLLIVLLLPAIEPWRTAAPQIAATVPLMVAAPAVLPLRAAAVHWRPEYWLWVVAAGGCLRLMWAAAGLFRLRRYHQQARPLAKPPLLFSSGLVSWYSSDAIPGPVTYGWRKPVILLPAGTLQMPSELREAIQCHELIHVHRRDWLYVLAETVLRALLWFHPAIWFITNRINLTREQVVDSEAVSLLRNRKSYLEALVAVAAHRFQPDFAPAFLRRRHLAARVNALMKETRTSVFKTAAALVAAGSAIPLAVGAALWMFPFIGQAQVAPDGPGVTVNPGAALLHRASVRAPSGSTASGTVILDATLAPDGNVSDARVISGPNELRNAALSSVLQWHYAPGPANAQISIQFAPRASTAAAEPPASPSVSPPAFSVNTAPPTATRTLQSIRISGISSEAERTLRSQLPIHEGDSITDRDVLAASATVRKFDSHLGVALAIGRDGAATLQIAPAPATPASALGNLPTITLPAPGAGAYRPGGDVSSPIPISRPEPQYSEEARNAHWGGSVVIALVVDENGMPKDLNVVKTLGLGLDEKAVDAVSQWRFLPGRKNGVAVPVSAQIEVTFRPR